VVIVWDAKEKLLLSDIGIGVAMLPVLGQSGKQRVDYVESFANNYQQKNKKEERIG
jgi:hypothetical protein